VAELLVQTAVSGVLWGFIFALIAIGLALIFGVMDIVNFAHGDFLMVSMYLAYVFATGLALDPLFSLPVVAAIVFCLGVAVYKTVIRRILDAPMLAQIFATFGLLVFLRGVAQVIFSPNYRSIKDPILSGTLELGGIIFSVPQLASAVGAVVVTGLVYWFLTRTETGWALQAVAQDKQAASLMGIDSDWMYALAWGVSSACVAVAGSLISNFYYIFPEVGFKFGLIAYVTVALGGFGSVNGALVAGLIVGIAEVLGGYLIGPQFKYVIVFLIYVGVVTLRPKGLMGRM